MIVVILGAPGAGKGTQAKMITSFLAGSTLISMSQVIRDEIASGSQDGSHLKLVMDQGHLVSDQIIVNILSKKLMQYDLSSTNLVFDGYPRTLYQASYLNDFVVKHNINLCIINLRIADQLLIERFSGRFICSECGASYHNVYHLPKITNHCDYCHGSEFYIRNDDKVEAVQVRLGLYHDNINPLLAYYEQNNLIHNIDASAKVEKVFENITHVLMDHNAFARQFRQ